MKVRVMRLPRVARVGHPNPSPRYMHPRPWGTAEKFLFSKGRLDKKVGSGWWDLRSALGIPGCGRTAPPRGPQASVDHLFPAPGLKPLRFAALLFASRSPGASAHGGTIPASTGAGPAELRPWEILLPATRPCSLAFKACALGRRRRDRVPLTCSFKTSPPAPRSDLIWARSTAPPRGGMRTTFRRPL
jgi:hypothetical protein